MRAWHGTLIAIALTLAALPFITLSVQGVMRPAEGFCIDQGFGQPRRAPAPADSYFAPPELSASHVKLTDWLDWPICARARHNTHNAYARYRDLDLARLGEPNFAQLHQQSPNAQMLRVLTQPSFSRDPIAITLRMGQTASLRAAWLVDDAPKPPPETDADANLHFQWMEADLPRAEAERAIAASDAERLWRLAMALPEHRERLWMGTLDGNWLVIERIDRGRRSVRTILLSEGGDAALLWCALAGAAGVPADVLAYGDVAYYCARGGEDARG